LLSRAASLRYPPYFLPATVACRLRLQETVPRLEDDRRRGGLEEVLRRLFVFCDHIFLYGYI